MTIGDLIEVPAIRTVIQLADAEREELQEELLDHFVFTHDVLQFFERLLPALQQPVGLGVFLRGHYGSGKSHCLAFLRQLLAGRARAWERLPQSLDHPQVRNQRWIVVSLPLFAYSRQHSLEELVLEALEDELARHLQHPPVLAQASRLLENFETYMLPVHRHRLEGYDDLSSSQKLQKARSFLREIPHHPLRLSYDRRQAMEMLQQSLGEARVVLLLDELSEFLRSKDPSSAAHREDIRFLQFLGEWSDKLPLWIVASLQHSLEEIEYGEESSELRIRERYPLRFQLSSSHVGDLISGRLVRHRPGAEEPLRSYWQTLNSLYPGLIGLADFLRIYPVHPITLEMLERLTPIFSRQRGVVDFVHTRLAGNPLRGVEGMLDEPGDHLLTADTLFDHFREHFADRSELAPYESTCWAYFERELPALFEETAHLELALATVKVLILAAISPLPVETSAEQLSLILGRKLSLINPKTNQRILQEKVLDVLTQRAAYVVKRGDQYRLDLQANLNQILGQRVREALQQLTPDWEWGLRQLRRPELPLEQIVGQHPLPARFSWRQAPREGFWAYLGGAEALSQLKALQVQLETGPQDCCLALLSPAIPEDEANSLIQSQSATPGMVLWKPARGEVDLPDQLLQWQAHEQCWNQDPSLRERLEAILRGLEKRVQPRLYNLYARGTLHWGGECGPPTPHEKTPERLLAAAVAGALERRFPRFARIAPVAVKLNTSLLKDLWQHFLESGSGPDHESLRQILQPLGLVEFEGEEGRLALLPGSPALAMLEQWQPEVRYSLESQRRHWQKSEWGMLPGQFYLVLAALAQLGKLAFYAHGRQLTLDSLDLLLQRKVEEFEVLVARSLPRVEDLQPLQWFFGEISLLPLSPKKVRELWRAAQTRLDELGELCQALGQHLQRLEELPGLPRQQLEARLSRLQSACLQVGTPHASAQGLKNLVGVAWGEIAEEVAELQAWSHFLEHQQPGLRTLRRRLEALGESQRLAELDGLLQGPEPWEHWPALRERCEEYEAQRLSDYEQQHQEYYQLPVFSLKKEWAQSPEWQLLLRLDRVLGFSPVPSVASLRHRLEAMPGVCRRRLDPLASSGCSCGFRPGQPPPDVTPWLADCRQALRQGALQLLREHDLGPYLRNLYQIGQEHKAHRLEQILELLDGLGQELTAPCCQQLQQLLDDTACQLLSQALTGQTLVVARDLANLVERLEGQKLPLRDLRRHFEDWLQAESLSHDSWISLESQPQKDCSGPWLVLWLEQHQLELTPALTRRFDLTGPAEGPPPEEALRPTLDDLSRSLDPVRAATQEQLFEGLSREFCRKAVESGQLTVDWGQRLPARNWPHLQLYRQIASWLQSQDFYSAARAWRDYQRLLYEQPEDCPEGLEVNLRRNVELHLPEAPPLSEGPQLLLTDCPQPWIVLVLDGLRWDLWDCLRPIFENSLGPPGKELLLRSPLPSNTRAARHAWLAGPEVAPPGAEGLLLGRPLVLTRAADDRRKQKSVIEQIGSGLPALMLHFQFIDRRAHQSELELWPLYRELLEEARVRLKPVLHALPPGRAVALLVDHGFLDPGSDPRVHGGDHWQETLVPAALWKT